MGYLVELKKGRWVARNRTHAAGWCAELSGAQRFDNKWDAHEHLRAVNKLNAGLYPNAWVISEDWVSKPKNPPVTPKRKPVKETHTFPCGIEVHTSWTDERVYWSLLWEEFGVTEVGVEPAKTGDEARDFVRGLVGRLTAALARKE